MGNDLIEFARLIPKAENEVWKIPMKVRKLLINIGLSFHNVSLMGLQDLLECTSTREQSQCCAYVLLAPQQTADLDLAVMEGVMSWETVRVGDLIEKNICPCYVQVSSGEKKTLKLLVSDSEGILLKNTEVSNDITEDKMLAWFLVFVNAMPGYRLEACGDDAHEKISEDTEVEVLSPIKECLDICKWVSKIPETLKQIPSDDSDISLGLEEQSED